MTRTVRLNLTLRCTEDAAWRALRQPAGLIAISAPLLRVRCVDTQPDVWPQDTPVLIRLKLLGLIPMGSQTVRITETIEPDGSRSVTDSGSPVSGPLRMMRNWNHRMSVRASADVPERCEFRDRLVVDAGWLTLPVWVSMWLLWQYRATRLRSVARTWH